MYLFVWAVTVNWIVFKQHVLILTVPEAENSKLMTPAGSVSGRNVLVHRQLSFLCPTWRGELGTSVGLLA